MLITFEGCDGFGKSTLINAVSKRIACTVTKEPGSTHVPINSQIRQMVLNEPSLSPMQRELLFYADALGHASYLSGISGTVLSDRGMLTHYAYLYGYMKLGMLGSDPDHNYTRYGLCKKLIKACCAEPAAIVYLEGDINLMLERRRSQQDLIEKLPKEFFSFVLSQYDDLLIAQELEGKPVLTLNARSSMEENVEKTLHFISGLPNRQEQPTIKAWES